MTPSRFRTVLQTTALAVIVMLLCRSAARAVTPAAPLHAAPRDATVYRDVAYGSDPRQRFDVHAPAGASGAPVIFMVHGGGWARGDKRARGVVDNKAARWVPRGFVVISTNYRMLPDAAPLDQAKDIARAIAVAQHAAAGWGGDSSKFILMGHSAGAHLVALLETSPILREGQPLLPWLGVVSLESGALDVVEIMGRAHTALYDRAFGRNPEYWRAASPYHTMIAGGAPMLLVCSVPRWSSCAQADAFAAKAAPLGRRVEVLRERLTHAEADQLLGSDSAYTAQVESFLRTLDTTVARLLPRESAP